VQIWKKHGEEETKGEFKILQPVQQPIQQPATGKKNLFASLNRLLNQFRLRLPPGSFFESVPVPVATNRVNNRFEWSNR